MKTRWSDGTVLIRPYEPGDVAALYEAARESWREVGQWLAWCHEGYSREESEDWIAEQPLVWKRGEAYSFGIFDAESGRYLGGTGLNTLHPLHRVANLGYWVRTSATGRGVAARAARLVARFGFEELGLTRIEIVVDVGNTASLRVAEKAGAHREAVLRNRLVNAGRANDAVMFCFVPEDFEPGKDV